MEYARNIGYKIKLLGRALRTGDDTVTAYVAVHLLGANSLLANVDDVMNGVVIHGNAVGECMFYGPGAGKLPAASAIVADVIDCVKHFQARKYLSWGDGFDGYVTSADDIASRWYVRTGSSLSEIGQAFGNVRFIHYPGAPEGEYAFISDVMDGHRINSLSKTMDLRSIYRILD
jgi:homoserine dehydrogenase